MYFRLADLLFRFRLKVLILILLAIHTLAMISVAVAALRQGSGETNKCELRNKRSTEIGITIHVEKMAK